VKPASESYFQSCFFGVKISKFHWKK